MLTIYKRDDSELDDLIDSIFDNSDKRSGDRK
jgi:hypothetical protein